MPIFDWFRPPRQLLTFFLAGTMAAATALAWLGWRLIGQEQALEAKRVRDQLEIAADRAAAALQRSITELERQLSADGAGLPGDTVMFKADGSSIEVRPPDSLVFYPFEAEAAKPQSDAFRAGEAAEYGGELAKAIGIYRDLARSADSPIKAGALMRLGRSLRNSGRPEESLQTYAELAHLGSIPLEGSPAELAAREARCTVLEETVRLDLLRREAQDLYRDLARGRWRLSHADWEFRMEEARTWAEPDLPPVAGLEASAVLSAAAESLWQRRHDLPQAGHEVMLYRDRPVLALWTATPERITAVLAGKEFLEAACNQAGEEARVRIQLADREGRVLLGQVSQPQAARAAATTRLPWDLSVSAANPEVELAEAGKRRQMLSAGLALLGALILGSGYFTFRGIRRELDVARLQSEFVSAVSHEFRTPLTSMRQLSEMLSKGRVISEDRRQQYYDVLARESERLHRLVEGLLNFGRAESGSARYRLEPLELGELVRMTAEEFERQQEEFKVELSLAEMPCRIRGDRDMLSLALWNLLDNAMKYSSACRTAWVDLNRNGSRAAIVVRDRGIGIPPDERRRVFEKFFRGAQAEALGVKGTGIGLAMVNHVARAHGGHVLLESEAGQGSTFTIVLPAEEKE